jgi:hypothetical protein
VTSDAEGLTLFELDAAGEPKPITSVAQPGQLPFFEQSPAGERMTHANGIVARSFTPLDAKEHWTNAPSSVGIHSAKDLSVRAVHDLGTRLDHQSLALSPDGKLLASVLRGAGAVVFDVASGQKLWELAGEIGSGTSWSPDGRWLALGETGQGGGVLTLIDAHADPQRKVALRPPSSGVGLYDSPFSSAFSRDGSRVVFTSSSWGKAGISVYDGASHTEVWCKEMPTTDEEDAENWLAPEVAFALDDSLVLAVQDGLARAFRAADGAELSQLSYAPAASRNFAVDSHRRRIWLGRGGNPSFEPFPDDWRA